MDDVHMEVVYIVYSHTLCILVFHHYCSVGDNDKQYQNTGVSNTRNELKRRLFHRYASFAPNTILLPVSNQ